MIDKAREIFLAALRERMQTTLAMLDFTGQTTNNVINRVLLFNTKQTNGSMLMTVLKQALPHDDKLRFP